jgi:hypothetical protein
LIKQAAIEKNRRQTCNAEFGAFFLVGFNSLTDGLARFVEYMPSDTYIQFRDYRLRRRGGVAAGGAGDGASGRSEPTTAA